MDGAGNIALGYSVSSGTLFPSIRYATRLASDPAGTLQKEATLIAGTASQQRWNRWGDYSSMNVDPTDDATFWYTSEYILDSGLWQTRIATFKLPTEEDVERVVGVNQAVADGSGSSGCFIATAAFGSPVEPYVKILRKFRDRILLNNGIGKSLVNFYYQYSPPVADCISRHDNLRTMVRICLLPVVGLSWLVLKLGRVPAFGLLLLFALMCAAGLMVLRRTHLGRYRIKRV